MDELLQRVATTVATFGDVEDAALDRARAQLTTYGGARRAALDDLDRQWAVLHGLQGCAQAVVDIASHVVASLGRDAADYDGEGR